MSEASITASSNPIFVAVGATGNRAQIKYEKSPSEQLWERIGTSAWSGPLNVHLLTGQGGEAERKGGYATALLAPGTTYDVCVCAQNHGPISGNFIPEASLTVFCLLTKPGGMNLIQDRESSHDFGGTWSSHKISTTVPTWIILIGVSRAPIAFNGGGVPILDPNFSDGSPTPPMPFPPILALKHDNVEINTLVPGHRYFFAVMVADALGNWDVRPGKRPSFSFTTLRRQLTVLFPDMVVFNDGDYATTGEGQFWFRLERSDMTGGNRQEIEVFNWSDSALDDWDNKGRPYKLGFAHLGQLETVPPESPDVVVGSMAKEEDTIGDDYARGGAGLPLPAGRLKENVSNQMLNIDCPATSHESSLHYSLNVLWSVTYAP